ncbi:MAG: UbiD family decarboxylase [Candidatus Tectomicrobia bacterium]|nr:UbiD family decarboxylase [Candidatus Tectomicrobia bacterium]
MPKDLRTFIDEVAEKRPEEIVRVEREVDPRFELTAVVEKLERQGQFPAVFFQKVKGSDIPVLINLTASYDRLAMALDTTLDKMVETFCQREQNPITPKVVSDAPVKEVTLTGDRADLSILPIPTHNALDAGPYICSGLGICKDPESGKHNVGVYRHMVHDAKTLGNWVYQAHHGYYIWQRYAARGEPMPFAIAIGHHPGAIMGAISRYPGVGGEYDGSGGLLGEPLELVPAETVDLLVPARAEIVIEGTVHPTELRQEGPFGEWPRYYTATGPKPVVHVTAITMRKNPIYFDLFAAHPEHNIVGGLPRMGSVYRRVKEVVPSVKAVNMPMSGGARAHAYISLKKSADGEPKQAAFAALMAENNIKLVILVDDDIDVFNEPEVLWAVMSRFEADRDLIVMPYCLGMKVYPTAYDITRNAPGTMNTKMILDATKPAPPAPFPERAQVPGEWVDRINLKAYIRPWS